MFKWLRVTRAGVRTEHNGLALMDRMIKWSQEGSGGAEEGQNINWISCLIFTRWEAGKHSPLATPFGMSVCMKGTDI